MPVAPGVHRQPQRASTQSPDLSAAPRGLECVWEYNGLVMNDRRRPDHYRIDDIGGLDDPDVRDSREDNSDRDGETAFDAFYSGRTITLSGKIKAHSMMKLTELRRNLKAAFRDLVERPLVSRFNDVYEDWIDDKAYLDWQFDAGIGQTSFQGVLQPTTGISSAQTVYQKLRVFGDQHAKIQFTTTSNLPATTDDGFGYLLKRISVGTYLRVFISSNGLRFDIVEPSGVTAVGTPSAVVIETDTTYWLVVDYKAESISASIYSSDPDLAANPTSLVSNGPDDVLTADYSNASGHSGLDFQYIDWVVNSFDVYSLDSPDTFINCRKSAKLQIEETQTSTSPERDFQIILRASDPKFYARRQSTASIVPQFTDTLGRVYDRDYDVRYDSYLGSDGAPVISGGNDVVLTNLGDEATPLLVVIQGGVTNPAILNLTNGMTMRLGTQIFDDNSVTIDTARKTVIDDGGNNVYSSLDDNSVLVWLDKGDNLIRISVSEFDGSPSFSFYWNHAWL